MRYVEGLVEPRGTARRGLRFSWVPADGTASRVTVRSGDTVLWVSDPVTEPWVVSPEDLEFPGLRVLDWNVSGLPGRSRFTTLPSDWDAARWMAHPDRPVEASRAGSRDGGSAAPVLRRSVAVEKPVRRALLALAAGGFVDVRVDGVLATDEVLSPGTTHWNRRVEAVVHDLTEFFGPGVHELSLELGRGFFGMTNANVWGWERAPWHDEPCVKALLSLEFVDGSRALVPSGPDWSARRGTILLDDLYGGEVVDLRHSGPEVSAAMVAGPTGEVVPRAGQPSRVCELLTPVLIGEPRSGEFVLDAQRVVSGWVRIEADLPAGTVVRVRYGERLRADGLPNADDEKNYFTDGFQTDEVIFPGGPVSWEPRFSYKGFRYVQVSGCDPRAVTVCVVHTDAVRTAEFSVDDPLLQWIHDATVRTMENNLHGYPTDTPKYEKNGWTGDALVGADMFLTNLDSAPVLRGWARTLAETARPIPALIAPNADVFGVDTRAPVWHAALLTVPWDVFRHTGDRRVLAENWAVAARYARAELDRSPGGLADTILGDWVAPGTDPGGGNPPEDSRIPATAFLVRILDVAGWTARELGDPAADWFTERAQEVRDAFRSEFLDASTGIVSGPGDGGFRQSHQVLALAFDLVPDDSRRRVAAALARDVEARGDHLDTGAMGTKWLLPVLTEAGFAELAVRVARQRTPPSWGAWYEAGATTTFEHWDLTARSHGHYFLGTVDDWLTGYVAGIRLGEPGWRSFVVDPRCTTWVGSASCRVLTPYGWVGVAWSSSGGEVSLDVEVPPGSRAVLAGGTVVEPGTHHLLYKS